MCADLQKTGVLVFKYRNKTTFSTQEGDSPVRLCAWTRLGCRPESPCRCTARVGRSECSRSGCSDRRSRLRRPTDRAGEVTRQWPSPQPSAPCTAALAERLNGSTRVTADSRSKRRGNRNKLVICYRCAAEKQSLCLRTLLSFPPEASSWWSVLHFSPQTSCLCPWRRRSDWRGGALMSRCRMMRSRLPDDSWSAFHAKAPGSEECKKVNRSGIDPQPSRGTAQQRHLSEGFSFIILR